ncbi:MAG: bifunctional phosphoribosyl-AMP cyclohydrolase/phosphoribosyl-ATP diphosphatase HisIE [Chloroflexi bacterium]|nr:bifunctional phosphoribosyl-AMP cyclohydrolase/phosphoribosyl-ATP diphosphatase HisIE [Chloroflexota bacterium]
MVKFNDAGLIPAIVQDADTGDVLTLAYMNQEALEKTLEGPDVWFFSRSRNELWHKGETSGNYLKVVSVVEDCDADAMLVKVKPTGPACHTGEQSCFLDDAAPDVSKSESALGPGVLAELGAVIADRKRNPAEGSYTTSLFTDGRERIAQKVIEEAGESAIAALGTNPQRAAEELGDLLYHCLVLMEDAEINPDLVWAELRARRK